MRLRRQGAPPILDAGRSGRLACVVRRVPRARARSAPPMAPPSGHPSSPCGDPHPPGGGHLRSAGAASAPGLARTFRTRPGVDHGVVSPARSSPGLSARHGRFPAVEAALVRFASFGARAGRRVAGAAHARGPARTAGSISRCERAGRVRGDRHRRRPRVPVRAVVRRPDCSSARWGARVVEERRSRAHWERWHGYPRQRPRLLPALHARRRPPNPSHRIRLLAVAPSGVVRAGVRHRRRARELALVVDRHPGGCAGQPAHAARLGSVLGEGTRRWAECADRPGRGWSHRPGPGCRRAARPRRRVHRIG